MSNYIKYSFAEILYILRLRKRPDISEYTHSTYCIGMYITKEAMDELEEKDADGCSLSCIAHPTVGSSSDVIADDVIADLSERALEMMEIRNYIQDLKEEILGAKKMIELPESRGYTKK